MLQSSEGTRGPLHLVNHYDGRRKLRTTGSIFRPQQDGAGGRMILTSPLRCQIVSFEASTVPASRS
jgi:hypothetical protein